MTEAQATKKQGNKLLVAIRAILFLVLAVSLFVYMNAVVDFTGTKQNRGTFNAFYDMPENSVDAVYIGSSATTRYFNNSKAFHDEGIATFSFGTPSMPFMFADNLIDEVEKTQNPKLYIIEIRNLVKEAGSVDSAHARMVTDCMDKFSENKVAMIDEFFEYMETHDDGTFDDKKIYYYLPFIPYHERILDGDLTEADWQLKKPYNYTQGFHYSSPTVTQTPKSEPKYTDEVGEEDPESAELLDEFLDYCDGLDAEVLFVFSPFAIDDEEISKTINALEKHVESRGYDCLNFNDFEMTDKLGIDFKTDFYNKNHTNYLGSEKYTEWFAEYLKNRYDLEDHRGDSTYDRYESGYEKYAAYVADGIKYVSKKDVSDDA